jgi:hypothetical protein
MLCFVLPLAGCIRDGPIETTRFHGVYADDALAGGMISLHDTPVLAMPTMTGITAHAIAGELQLPGGPSIPLAGSYQGSIGSASLTFANGDHTYVFDGAMSSGLVTGDGDVPGGRASFGLFVDGTPSTIATYCGTAACTEPSSCSAPGALAIAVRGATGLAAIAIDGSAHTLVGTATRSALAFQTGDALSERYVTVEGIVSGGSASGTWTDHLAARGGTWSATVGACEDSSRRARRTSPPQLASVGRIR